MSRLSFHGVMTSWSWCDAGYKDQQPGESGGLELLSGNAALTVDHYWN